MTDAWRGHPVLITGAAGFAGSHLLEWLSTPGGTIVAWRRPGGSPPSVPVHAMWDTIDLLDRDATASAIERLRPGAVYHCAGAAHVGRAWNTTEATLAGNVRATHHLLDALRRARVACRVLIPSSAMLYRPVDRPLTEDDAVLPSNPYGLSKLAQELLALKSLDDGIDIRIARPFNHVGPRQDPWFVASGFARRIADIEAGRWAPEIAVGNLDARRDLTDVRDTVRGYQLIMERGRSGRIYNICSGQAVAIRELLDRLLARARVPIKIVVDSSRLRPNDAALLLGDCTRIRSELGWAPTITLEQTLDDLLAYWRGRDQ